MKMMKNFLIAFLYFISIAYPLSALSAETTDVSTFAGGCFWCSQADFDKVPGVVQTIVGYTGGNVVNPTYEQVTNGNTGHYESIQVVFNPAKISYQQLLDFFWHTIDPTNPNGQFCDTGNSYRAVIFYHNEEQKEIALRSKEQLIKSNRFKQVATQILPVSVFYPAEEYHQKYYQKRPVRYQFYRFTCGRDERLKELWKK